MSCLCITVFLIYALLLICVSFRFLNGNQLTSLGPESGLSWTRKLRIVRLENNPIDCKCSLHTLLFFSRQVVHFELYGGCKQPRSLANRQLRSLTNEELNCRGPQFLDHPKDLVLSSSFRSNQESYRLTCEVSSEPEATIIWTRNGEFINEHDSNSGLRVTDNGRVLKFVDNFERLEGHYKCLAANFMAEVSSRPAIVKFHAIQEIPQALRFKSSSAKNVFGEIKIKTIEGSEVVLDCSIEDETAAWSFNKRNVQLDGFRKERAANGSLVIRTVLSMDAGKYSCSNTRIELEVQSPPVLINSPESLIVVKAGDALKLVCEASGNPVPVIVWSDLNQKRNLSVGEKFAIKAIKSTDEGLYECRALNEVGLAAKEFRLEVKGGSDLVISPSSASFISSLSTSSGRLSVFEQFEMISSDEIRSAAAEAKLAVNEAIEATLHSLRTVKSKNPGRLMKVARYPFDPDSRDAAKAAEVFYRSLEILKRKTESTSFLHASDFHSRKAQLSSNQLNLLSTLSGCEAGLRNQNVRNSLNRINLKEPDCSSCFHKKYRTFDGTCNNEKQPFFGSALRPFRRVLVPEYEDGLYKPRGYSKQTKIGGFELPSARKVSLLLSSKATSPDSQYSHMFMQFGQFFDHDLDHTLSSISFNSFAKEPIDCSRQCSEHIEPCFSIPLEENDPRWKRQHLAGRKISSSSKCIELVRSAAFCGSGLSSVVSGELSKREQVNQITSFLDGSTIYGSNEQLAAELRRGAGFGQLRTLRIQGKEYPPHNDERRWPMDCQQEPGFSDHTCYLTGDARSNEQLGLLSLHVIFVREHNRISKELKRLNPVWNSETTFQQSRKIVIAQLQRIAFEEWIPKALGPIGMQRLGTYQGYNASLDSSISNVFATAALRFGHTLVEPFLARFNESNFPHEQFKELPLHEAFFAPHLLAAEGGVDPLLRGLIATSSKALRADQVINSELTEHLFELSRDIALDLAAINIQRGRDHGLPGYNEWRKFCGLKVASTFEDLKSEIPDTKLREKLSTAYGNPSNVDLWAAGVSEQALPGGRVGPTFACLLAEQFKRTRESDRFWYQKEGVFETRQRLELEKSSLASVLCNNGDNFKRIPKDVFLREANVQKWTSCKEMPNIDLKKWTLTQEEESC